ncbi:MAG: (E)-4-hydroxy-3-methylbut-2-enyl-diphosphate synthase [Verrucomicrobia bacterium]|nr:(E)-4-hydroxy-3-methylbut-2-enyl-diphosphate synthase [Verrucomicrobiota bacterium]MDA1067933.1 (E)-4-hydroxy-3-methylbut-2-enyl-diphosphate synthase [Verrucomicrobiota bacterium]
MKAYCASRLVSKRRITREVKVGNVGVGDLNPIRIQSMTTTLTTDIEATVRQTRALVEAGCEIVRITAPNVNAAKALAVISKRLKNDKIDVPLVADIHFLPSAAMEAVEHVEKVRVNPGNYADKKKFQIIEYSDDEYRQELERLHESFSPLVKRCKILGRSIRIGTNHGSLSDRIMNRFGDSPLGMVESALEFIRIAEAHNFYDIILSMKASNPKVMIQAYRLAVAKMAEENMQYPLHLGVTEAGDGEDGRIKSAIGIGSLLIDGLGDTIRVSLTEDPVYEIPVAQALAKKATYLWSQKSSAELQMDETVDPFTFTRREVEKIDLNQRIKISSTLPPIVFLKNRAQTDIISSVDQLSSLTSNPSKIDTPVEGWVIELNGIQDIDELTSAYKNFDSQKIPLIAELGNNLSEDPRPFNKLINLFKSVIFAIEWPLIGTTGLQRWVSWAIEKNASLAIGISAEDLAKNASSFIEKELPPIILFTQSKNTNSHPIGDYRLLISIQNSLGLKFPVWLRVNKKSYIQQTPGFLNDLLEASLLAGSLLSDGFGDILSIECVENQENALSLAYNVLQGAGARISKTEYVACPSCGRTLFDLQKTTQTIRKATEHLKGVKIAVMGCIVNGPGEMADADFGYVGGAPGKVNLYVGKDCVEYHVKESEAVSRLIDLIKKEGKWAIPKEPMVRTKA